MPKASACSMHAALGRITRDQGALQRYYVYNLVSYHLRACGAEHLCALRKVAFDACAACLCTSGSAPAPDLELLQAALLCLRALLAR
ncbi:Acid sphingomyelinase-like phosphodiesterase 3b [Pteropus alecto]|uniref:Acid sphingomyelinase-like phosphodiesterase 3b n=1 Tax=Pteropus alecto TaxID=9402 RepID=L5KVL7_PTEAL|nr:Acid sphingomyelinase-like phosphodiesterase 3b [Pteropus alecto]